MRPSHIGACLVFGLAVASIAVEADATGPHAPRYGVVDRIAGPGTDWDDLTVDPLTRRLYIAHSGVTVLDLKTRKLTTGLVAGKVTHVVLPLGDGIFAVDDSIDFTLTLFNGASGKVLSTLKIPRSSTTQGFRDPDALLIEPKTGLLVVVNADSGELVLVDLKTLSVVATIPLGSGLDGAVADGTGRVFVNGSERNTVFAVDIVQRKVTGQFPLKGCEEPTALALDDHAKLLVSVCSNGLVKFLQPKSGRDVKTLKIGKGGDGLMIDDARRLVFVPSGENGTLSVISVRDPDHIALLQTVQTKPGVRTGALDPATGRLYLPAAKFAPPTAEFPFPTAIEGTFEILVVAPK